MSRKYPIFDFFAALAFVFDVDWDEDFECEEYDDYFWDGEQNLKISPNEKIIELNPQDAV